MDGQFDYVIVGAGSAGCALAERLGRDGKSRILVLEAGGSDNRFFIQMPLGYGKTFWDKTLNWGYRTEPDEGLAGQSEYWPRGRVVGGSSSLNAMVWIRGDRRDYDDWAAEGNPGWAWSDVLPIFKAIEDNQAGANQWRGKGGPIHISDVSNQLHPLAERYVKAGRMLGYRANDDFNGESQEGIGVYQINTKGGWRMSAAKAFLKPAIKRGNVVLTTGAQATRILFEGKRAIGVEYIKGGVTKSVRAAGEVILSGGSVNTPQLLELSGIGDPALLSANGIATLVDSPAVGNHMQDHLGINYIYRSKVPTLNQPLGSFWGRIGLGLKFLLTGQGCLALSLNQGGGFVKSRPDLDRPNVQLYFQAISTFTAKSGTRPLLGPDPFPGFAIGLSNTRPTARGSIHIRSKSPLDHPCIRANCFGTEHDVADMLEGVKILRAIAAQPPMADVIAEELAPGPSVQSDADLIADFRKRSGTVYHPCGTARMGSDARSSVVDARLRVRGVEGLRVADASVFPSVISGNTNAPAIMVGAKAGQMIIEDRSA